MTKPAPRTTRRETTTAKDGKRRELVVRYRSWVLVAAGFAITAALLALIGAPSPYLLAGVVAGAGRALSTRQSAGMPKPLRTGALAMIGVAAGSAVHPDVIAQVVQQPWVILGGAVGTLVVTLLAGQLLRLSSSVDSNTAMFASIAGGASGLTVMARELDSDERIVAAVQYLRVLVVVATVPFVAPLLGHGNGVSTAAGPIDGALWSDLVFTGVALAVGLGLARLLTFSASALVLPMTVAAGLSWWGILPNAQVPAVLLNITYAVIGLMVGLDLSRDVLRRIAALLPLAGAMLVISLGACAVLGIALGRLMGVSAFSSYLAFTPGGLPAVTAVAVGAGAETEFVVSCQIVRLLLALLIASVVGGMMRRHQPVPKRRRFRKGAGRTAGNDVS